MVGLLKIFAKNVRRGGRALSCALALGLVAALAGCGSVSPLDSVDSGRTFSYIPGLPNFDLEAVGTWRDRRPGVDVYLSIPYNSLSFLNTGDEYSAEYSVTYQLLNEDGDAVLAEQIRDRTLRVATYDSTQQVAPFVLTERIPAPAGLYVIQAALEDKNSGETAYRAQRVRLVDVESDEPSLSRIRLEGLDRNAGFEPLLAAHLPERVDSLRAVVELYNAPERIEASMVLFEPETDAAPAEPPYWFQIRNQRYVYQGLDFRRADTLQVSRRLIRNPSDELTIEFRLPALPVGVYRIEIKADLGDEDDVLLERRDFTVKDPSFPEVTTLDEMIESLIYIAREREVRAILEAGSTEEKRKAFEAFWLRIGKTPGVAADLIKRYYSRVEEANKLFSSHKAGWKTDQGMVYIIMGPPNYVDRRYGDGRRLYVWRYPPPKQARGGLGYYPMDPQRSPVSQMETRFIFEEARKLDRDIPYPQFILRRHRVYQQIWDEAIDMWRSGRVL